MDSLDNSATSPGGRGFFLRFRKRIEGGNAPGIMKCIFEIGDNFGPGGKSNAMGVAITHEGNLMIPGTEDFIEF